MGKVAAALAQARALVATLEALEAAEATVVAPPPVKPAPGPSLEPLAWGKKVSSVFRDRVRWIADDLGFDPNWLMAWMAFETGRSFSPTIKNPGSTGTGLIQFMQATAEDDLKTTLAHLRSLSAEDQLNWVWKYLRNRVKENGPIRRVSDGYMAILLPTAMTKPDSAVLWPQGTRAYLANKGLDVNKDGSITKAEAAAKIYAILAEGLKPENVA